MLNVIKSQLALACRRTVMKNICVQHTQLYHRASMYRPIYVFVTLGNALLLKTRVRVVMRAKKAADFTRVCNFKHIHVPMPAFARVFL